MALMDEFEGKMLTAVREYERNEKTAGLNSPLIKHYGGKAEMYASVIVALKAVREEHDYNYPERI